MKSQEMRLDAEVDAGSLKITEKRINMLREGSKGTYYEGCQMHQNQEIDGDEDRKPGGRTIVKEMWKVWG